MDADRPRPASAPDPRSHRRVRDRWPDLMPHSTSWQTRHWLEGMETEYADLTTRLDDLEARVAALEAHVVVAACGIIEADATVIGHIGGVTVEHLGTGQYKVNHSAAVPTGYVVLLTAASFAGDPSYAVIGAQEATSFQVFTFRETGQPRDLAFVFQICGNA
jgi:hypothetical protein